MPNEPTNPNVKLPNWVYGYHYSGEFINLPRPVWQSSMEWVANNIQYLHQECYKPNESYKPCESNQCDCDGSAHSKFNDNCHICTNHSERTCNCTGTCPDNIQDGFSDNTGYITEHLIEHEAIGISAKGESISWWSGPCVVIGDIRQARDSSAESISSDKYESGNTQRDTDTR